MKRYISYRKLIKTFAFALPLITALFIVASCSDDDVVKINKNHNFSMAFGTRSAETDQIVDNVQLFTFHSGGGNDKTFYRKILNLDRNTATSTVTASVETGDWHIAMVAPPTGVSIIEPTGGAPMSELPMYKYAPTFNTTTGRHADAPENLFFANDELPFTIVANQSHSHNTQLNRNVAMVQVIIEKTTANFNLEGQTTPHKITLHNIPSTISYTGELLKETGTPGVYVVDKDDPDLVSGGISSYVKLKQSTVHNGFLCDDSDETDVENRGIKFIIPAHRSLNFLTDPSQGATTLKMNLTIDLERTGGSRFSKTVEIDKVAYINNILRVNITINDGILVESEIVPWERVNMGGTVGAEYKNWLYVKKNATGTGASWSDAAPSISAAITRAEALIAAGETVHGILVAGGSSSVYSENGMDISENIRIFGGWAGTAGTELPGANANEVYAPNNGRDIKDYKAYVNVGANKVSLDAGSVLDGFVLSGTGGAGDAMVSVAGNNAWMNAVEINQQTVSTTYTLSVSNNGTASNVLIAQNSKGVSVATNGKLVNGTIVQNTGTSIINGATVYNTIFWPNNPNTNGTNDIQYSAFIGNSESNIPSGTGNIHINATNDAWFSGSITAPGPHFKLTTDSERYKAASNRAPMVGRGNEVLYTAAIGQTLDMDINGNKRYDVDPQDGSKMLMDIGCYEDNSSLTGFRLTWAADRLYISANGGYTNRLPLMLPGNADPETEINVTWNATVTPLTGVTPAPTTWSNYLGLEINTTDNVVVGTLIFKNEGETPEDNYTGSADRQWGNVVLSTNLGGYLPNTTVGIYQLPGQKTLWEDGYVGSFHRNNEVGARYISGPNTGATHWEARIISGLDWIKIDKNPKDFGDDITDIQEGRTPSGGYYKEVVETWGGVIPAQQSGTIRFRVGMKSKNPNVKPRYGLIAITRGTLNSSTGRVVGGTSMFFVRQGEEPDLVYTKDDARKINGVDKGRLEKYLTPFTVYNLTAPAGTTNATNGVDLSRSSTNKATFVKYPTQIGYYFRFNTVWGYPHGKTTGMNTTIATRTSYSATYEVCPTGYRHPAQEEYMYTIYDRAEVNTSVSTGRIDPSTETSRNNFMLGAYADGYYDQLAADPVNSSIVIPNTFLYNGVTAANAVNELTPGAKGILMVSHFNYASIFFPISGTMTTGGGLSNNSPSYAMYPAWLDIAGRYASTNRAQYYYRNTHWGRETAGGHIGMNCTGISTNPAPVRCVKATSLP